MPICLISLKRWLAAWRDREGIFGATARFSAGGAAKCVCRMGKAQDFFLRESFGRHDATLRLLANHLALASHYGINL